MSDGRDERWNTLKGALIITVVIGHFCQLYMDRNLIGGGQLIASIFCLVYSFHMPLFVFISGYFSKNLKKRQEAAFTELFIPFVVWQVIIGLVIVLTDKDFSLFRNPLNSVYGTWYLIALFIWRRMTPNLLRVRWIFGISILMFFVTPLFWGMDNTLGLQRAMGFFCFFLCGYYCKEENMLAISNPIILLQKGIGVFKRKNWVGNHNADITRDNPKKMRRVRHVCIAAFVVELVAFYICFDILEVPYGAVFNIFVHGLTISRELWKVPYVMAGYIAALMMAIVNSILFINIFFIKSPWILGNPKSTLEARFIKAITHIGEDTMPIYLGHLVFVKVYAALMRNLPDTVYLIFGEDGSK